MKKVLSIDDSRMVRMQVKKAFSAFNVNVLEAENGIHGLEMARAHKPDLVFLDITMPEMSGEEMLPILRKDPEIGTTPVIMLSADLSRDTMLKMARLGSNDYVPKPFKHQQLVDKAERFLGEALDPKSSPKPVEEDSAFKIEEQHLIVSLNSSETDDIKRIMSVFPERLMEAIQNRVEDVFLDLSKIKKGSEGIANCLQYVINNCDANHMRSHIIASESVESDVRRFNPAKGWSFYRPDHHLE